MVPYLSKTYGIYNYYTLTNLEKNLFRGWGISNQQVMRLTSAKAGLQSLGMLRPLNQHQHAHVNFQSVVTAWQHPAVKIQNCHFTFWTTILLYPFGFEKKICRMLSVWMENVVGLVWFKRREISCTKKNAAEKSLRCDYLKSCVGWRIKVLKSMNIYFFMQFLFLFFSSKYSNRFLHIFKEYY